MLVLLDCDPSSDATQGYHCKSTKTNKHRLLARTCYLRKEWMGLQGMSSPVNITMIAIASAVTMIAYMSLDHLINEGVIVNFTGSGLRQ